MNELDFGTQFFTLLYELFQTAGGAALAVVLVNVLKMLGDRFNLNMPASTTMSFILNGVIWIAYMVLVRWLGINEGTIAEGMNMLTMLLTSLLALFGQTGISSMIYNFAQSRDLKLFGYQKQITN